MPLRDHFHEPFIRQCDWTSFHGTWITTLVQRLNAGVLPPQYAARSFVHLGSQIEMDVVAYERESPDVSDYSGNGEGGVAVAAPVYVAPAPIVTAEAAIDAPDVFEMRIYRDRGGWQLVAAIELVSPANKDRSSHRRAFATKTAAYLQQGVAVVTVDVVTNRRANLHDELVELLHLPDSFDWESPTTLAGIAYRTVQAKGAVRLDVWPYPLAVGQALPTVPLWLAADLAVPLELELTYESACQSLRIH